MTQQYIRPGQVQVCYMTRKDLGNTIKMAVFLAVLAANITIGMLFAFMAALAAG